MASGTARPQPSCHGGMLKRGREWESAWTGMSR
jgi:hypothetical protein